DLCRMRSAAAVISHDHRRHTLHEVIEIAVPHGIEQIGIRVCMRIDESWADNEPCRINHARRAHVSLGRIADEYDAIVANTDIRLNRISTRPVHHLTASYQQIKLRA